MDLDESLQYVLRQKEPVTASFYDLFLARCPEARQLFENIDMRKQALMLSMALIVVEAHRREDYAAIEHYLHVLGDRHRNAGVRKELFPVFRECLVETLARLQSEHWSEGLAEEWRQAIDRASETMFEGYDSEFPF